MFLELGEDPSQAMKGSRFVRTIKKEIESDAPKSREKKRSASIADLDSLKSDLPSLCQGRQSSSSACNLIRQENRILHTVDTGHSSLMRITQVGN